MILADNLSGYLLEASLDGQIIFVILKKPTVTFEIQKTGSSGTGFGGVTMDWCRGYDGFALVK